VAEEPIAAIHSGGEGNTDFWLLEGRVPLSGWKIGILPI